MLNLRVVRRLTAVIGLAVLMLPAAACGGNSGPVDKPADAKKKTIIIGTSGDFPPYEFRDDGGKVVGFIPEMLDAVLPGEGYDYKFVQISFAGLPAALESGRIDMITALYESPERLQAMDFASSIAEQKMIVVRADDANKVTSWSDLCDKKVGVIIGSPVLPVIVKAGSEEACVSQGKPAIRMANYQSVSQELRDLENGRVDAGIEGVATFGYIVKQNPGKYATAFLAGDPTIAGWAVKKGSPLLPDLKSGLEKFLTSPDQVKALSEKWGLPDGFFLPHVKVS
jgi:polar amino acid transport system substrate-binding protein